MSDDNHVWQATPTMWEFMNSPAYVRVLAGPIGAGKSVCCIHEIFRLALQQKPNSKGERKSRTLIVRNTADQLRSTTLKTLFDWFPPGVWGVWRSSEKTMYVDMPLEDGTTLKMEIWASPLDTPDDVRKALSLELTFLFGNEWRELHPQVVDGLLSRLKRYPSRREGGPTRSCAFFDTNMPDVDSWHFDKMENPPSNWEVFTQPPAILDLEEYIANQGEDPEDEGVEDSNGKTWFLNPNSDNLDHLDPTYYQEIIPGKSVDFVDIYLRCKYGRSLSGLPVYDKTFSLDTHVATTPFSPIRSEEYPVVIGLDFGRTPAATFLQRNVFGQVIALGELNSENMGIETFVSTKLRPFIAQPEYAGCTFLVAPDPAGWAKQQIGEISPVDVIKAAGFKVVKPITNDPERRILAVERLLTSNVGGRPALVINPECTKLIAGFRYGYRFKLNKAGQQDVKPDKNEFSHGADATQYGVLVIEGNQLIGSYFGNDKRRDVKQVKYVY